MKILIRSFKWLADGFVLTLIFYSNSLAQQLQFTKIIATDESAIQLQWFSESNAVYRVEYASQLSNEILWETLVDGFPSQGTNTMFLDTGKYWTEPAVAHPKDDVQRFYRVVKIGVNSLPPPTVTITNPLPNSVLSGEVTINVHIATTNGISFIHYFVDGEEVEVGGADDEGNSNYTINTTEWPNGPHVVFVVVEIASGSSSTGEKISDEHFGAGTSAIIPVTFNNWISRWYFSLPGFDSSLGETQQVTARFEDYSCWTLEIVNEYNRVVRNASGNGFTMIFDWDGKDDFGFEVDNGTYDFILTADQCNPLQYQLNSNANIMRLSASSSETIAEPQLFAQSQNGSIVPLILYPPGFDTNNLTIFEGLWADYNPSVTFVKETIQQFAKFNVKESNIPAASAPQSTRRPRRPPPNPIKGNAGKIGVAYQGHHPDTTNSIPGFNPPPNLIGNIQLIPNYVLPYGHILNASNIASGFELMMKKYKWTTSFNYGDNQLTANLLRKPSKGGSNLFNYCNIGLLIGHGIRGGNQDFRATSTPSLQTYFPIYKTGVNTYDWIRMSEFDFGGGPIGLRWMGIYACNMLYRNNAIDMYNKGVLPINPRLHILLGEETSVFMYPTFGRKWASYMNGGEDGVKHTIIDSWNLASHDIHSVSNVVPIGIEIIMTSAYWPDCVNDRLLYYTENGSDDPSEILFWRQRVFPTYEKIP